MKDLPPPPDQVLADLTSLVPVAYEAMEIGTQVATHFFRSLAAQDRKKGRQAASKPDVDLYPQLVRFFAKREFDRFKISAEFERETLRNNGLFLHYRRPTREYNIRLLKNDAGQLPAPGKSMSKVSFYQQSLSFMDGDFSGPSLNLVILWYINGQHWLDHLSLVCPKGGSENSAEAYWQHPIPHPADAARENDPAAAADEIQITPKRIRRLGSGEKE
jgi:hypothetical protein